VFSLEGRKLAGKSKTDDANHIEDHDTHCREVQLAVIISFNQLNTISEGLPFLHEHLFRVGYAIFVEFILTFCGIGTDVSIM